MDKEDLMQADTDGLTAMNPEDRHSTGLIFPQPEHRSLHGLMEQLTTDLL